MGIVINSCVTGMHGMCLYSYMHTSSTYLTKLTEMISNLYLAILIISATCNIYLF